MKIREIHITPVAVPDPPLLNAAGLHAPYALRLIVEIVGDGGMSGWGEIPGGEATRAALETAAERLIGLDPWGLNAIDAELARLARPDDRGANPWDQRTWVHIRSAIEVACYDLMGVSVGRPVVDLLGGAARERVPSRLISSTNTKAPAEKSALALTRRRLAGRRRGSGRRWMQRASWRRRVPWWITTASSRSSSRAALLNHKWRWTRSWRCGMPLGPICRCGWIQMRSGAWIPPSPPVVSCKACWNIMRTPVRGQADMAAVARALEIPLATNMCTTSFEDLPGSVAHQSEAIILSDHHFWGGFRASLDLARFCAVFGRGLSMHSNSHLGISLAAMVQLAAAVPNLGYDCDTHYPWQDGHDLLVAPLRFEEGAVEVPRAPGLGIEVDRDKLAQMHARYLACGLTERNDEIEMQQVRPGWRFQATRW